MDFHKKETWFAVGSLIAAIVLLLIAGWTQLAWIGLGMTVMGIGDFLFFGDPFDRGYVDDVHDAYGDVGEELWQFRSFIMMVGGPLVILYGIIFQ